MIGTQILAATGGLILLGLAVAVGPHRAAIVVCWGLLAAMVSTESTRVWYPNGRRLSIGVWHNVIGSPHRIFSSKRNADHELLKQSITLMRIASIAGLLVLTGIQTNGLLANLSVQDCAIFYHSGNAISSIGSFEVGLRFGPWLFGAILIWIVGIESPRRIDLPSISILMLGSSVATIATTLQAFSTNGTSFVEAIGWLLVGVAGVSLLTGFTTIKSFKVSSIKNGRFDRREFVVSNNRRSRRLFQSLEIPIVFLYTVVFLLTVLTVLWLMLGQKWALPTHFTSVVVWFGLLTTWVLAYAERRRESQGSHVPSISQSGNEIGRSSSTNFIALSWAVFVTFAVIALHELISNFGYLPSQNLLQIHYLLYGWVLTGGFVIAMYVHRRLRLGDRFNVKARDLWGVDLLCCVSFLIAIYIYLHSISWAPLIGIFVGWAIIQSIAAGLFNSSWRKLAAVPMAIMATTATTTWLVPNWLFRHVKDYLWFLVLGLVLVSVVYSIVVFFFGKRPSLAKYQIKKTHGALSWPHFNSVVAVLLFGIGGLESWFGSLLLVDGVLPKCIALILLSVTVIDFSSQIEQSLLRVHLALLATASMFAAVCSLDLTAIRGLSQLVWLVTVLATAIAVAIYSSKKNALAQAGKLTLASGFLVLEKRDKTSAFALSEWWRLKSRLLKAHLAIAGFSIVVSCSYVFSSESNTVRDLSAGVCFLAALAIASVSFAVTADSSRNKIRRISVWIIHISIALLVLARLPDAAAQLPISEYWLIASRLGTWMILHSLVYWWLGSRKIRESNVVLSSDSIGLALQWVSKQRLLDQLSWAGVYGASTAMCVVVVGCVFQFEEVRLASLLDRLLLLILVSGLGGRLILAATKRMAVDSWLKGRDRLVAFYGFEACLFALVGFAYIGFPSFFGGRLTDWWPVAVFAVAIFAAAVGEFIKRTPWQLFSDPIARSSWVLPIIPYAAIWVARDSYYTQSWGDYGMLVALLSIAAAIYGVHGWIRRSRPLQAVAGGLALLGFWTLLYSQEQLRFENHPQFWLLPPAVATLVLVEFNRKTLDRAVAGAARYLSLLVAYLSSSFEIILKSFDGQIWPPIILMTLALLGFFVGIAFRIRACLYCGALFVLVALIGMVWHAQQAIDQIWPWWLFGISMGVAIIVGLGVLEKNRSFVNQYVNRVRNWDC